MAQDRASWKIKGEKILSELITLMDLTLEEQALLGSLQSEAREVSPRMIDAFYSRLFKHENTSEYLKDASMDRLHSMLAEWFADLFSGVYDETYARKRLTIGEIHVRIGLPVRYPLAMLDVVMPFGEAIARTASQPDRAAAAFHNVLGLDVAIFNQAYEDNQLKHLADLVGGERLARRLLSEDS